MRVNKAPVTTVLTDGLNKIGKGWLDWVLDISRALGGEYQFTSDYAMYPKHIVLSTKVAIDIGTYDLVTAVEDGVVSVDNFNSSDFLLSIRRIKVIDSTITIPIATEGYYMITGSLIRSEK